MPSHDKTRCYDGPARPPYSCDGIGNRGMTLQGLGLFNPVSEANMNIFAYRRHLRFLSHQQRRVWWDQRKRLTPRVRIGGAYVPPNVSRAFTYVKVG